VPFLKVGFLPLYNIHLPSSRYRVFQFIEPLVKLGFSCRILDAPERRMWKRLLYIPKLFLISQWADVLFIQKRGFPDWVLNSITRINPRIIYDFDDAVSLRPTSYPNAVHMMQAAAHIIAGNEFLAKTAVQYNPCVTILPTVVDVNVYSPPTTPKHPADSRVWLGWIGIDPNRGDLALIEPVFTALASSHPQTVLRVVSDRGLNMITPMPVEFVHWELTTSLHELQQFDIGLMPLTDNAWNHGKCAFKLIQYMAVGIPAVASPVGANRMVVQDGKTGYLANTTDEWVNRLSQLIENVALRQEIGKQARTHIVSHYSIEQILPSLVDILQQVAGKR